MSEATTYNVSVVYKLSDSGAPQKVDKLADSFKTVAGLSSSVAGKMDSLAMSIMSVGKWALVAAGALGLRTLQQSITSLNSEAETAQLGIAGMLQAGGAFKTFEGAMGRSQELMEEMRRDAAALPGTFDDLRRVFEGGLLGGLAAGKTSKQVEKLAASFMSVGKMLNIDSHTSGRELAMLLEGRAGAHVVMWARLRPLIGKTAQEFNSMTNKERFDAIEKALKGFDPAVKAFAHTWDAISSTTKDIWTHFKRMAGTPMFNALKDDLQQINTFAENNKALLAEWEMIIGGNIVRAYDHIKDAMQWIIANHTKLLTAAKHAAEGGLVMRAGLGLLGNAGAMGMARTGLTAIGGLVGGGVGSGALLAAAVVAPLAIAAARGKVDLERLFGSLERAASPLVTSFGHLGEALLPTIEDLGRFTAGLVEAVASGLTPLTNLLGRFINLQADSIRYWSDRFRNVDSDRSGYTNPATPGGAMMQQAHDMFDRDPDENLIGALLAGHVTLGGSLFHPSTWSIDRALRSRLMPDNQDERMDDQGIAGRHFRMRELIQEETRRQVHAQGHTNITARVEVTVNDASDPTRVYADVRRAVFDAVFRPTELPKTQVLR